MGDQLHCWRCGGSLAGLSLPLRRAEECPACRSQLHVCRMCLHFDRGRSRQCRQEDAEEVRTKDRANFCDYFRPSTQAFDGADAARDQAARDAANALFGPGKS